MFSLKQRFTFQLVALLGSTLLSQQAFAAAPDSEIVAVFSRASSDYKRTKMPDGTFTPETFVFGKGGVWAETAVDSSIDKIQFTDVARTIADPLALKGFVSSRDPKTTKLLIMVYWGKTNTPPNANESVEAHRVSLASERLANAMINPTEGKKIYEAKVNLGDAARMETLEDIQRDRLNAQNASMLGYDEVWKNTMTLNQHTGPMSFRRNDLIDELEDRRYFVVLMAYDFQLLWKQRKHKLLWETRFSIRDHGHEFDKALGAMARDASKYFGQDTHGVVHKELPKGKIEFGEIKVMDDKTSK